MDDPQITRLQRRLLDASLTIGDVEEDRPTFLHSVLCQLGLPRSRTERARSRARRVVRRC